MTNFFRSILLTAATVLVSGAAFAATEAELRARCTADGGTPTLVGNTIDCAHPGPQTAPGGAPSLAHTFEFEGAIWTVVEGPPAAISAVHMAAGAAKACPSLKVRLEASKAGPPMTAEQKFRGDKRWHVVCAS